MVRADIAAFEARGRHQVQPVVQQIPVMLEDGELAEETSGRNHQSKPDAQNSTAAQTCFRCGGKGHSPDECFVWRKGMTCNYCKKKGHLMVVCRAKKRGFHMEVTPPAISKKQQLEEEIKALEEQLSMLQTRETQATREERKPEIRAVVPCMVGNARTTVELDTGDHVTVMGEEVYHQLRTIDPDLQLEDASRRPLNADRSPMEVMGDLEVVVSIGPAKVLTNICVVKGIMPFLLGMEDIRALGGWIGDCLRVGNVEIPFLSEMEEEIGMVQSVTEDDLDGPDELATNAEKACQAIAFEPIERKTVREAQGSPEGDQSEAVGTEMEEDRIRYLEGPTALRKLIWQEHRLLVTGAHEGGKKMYAKIHRKWIWRRMRDDIQRYANLCITCRKRRPSCHVSPGQLTTGTLIEIVALDQSTIGQDMRREETFDDPRRKRRPLPDDDQLTSPRRRIRLEEDIVVHSQRPPDPTNDHRSP
eukprot:GHVO01052518.1.p1 GENE.GHVO01052518.1~~GHVO01052518.1.p1  ORF type:complete len:553 (-),score=54.65 GHVO01052518.1:214-1635(-)